MEPHCSPAEPWKGLAEPYSVSGVGLIQIPAFNQQDFGR